MTQPVADTRLHPATLVSRTLRTIPEAFGGVAGYAAITENLGRILLFLPFALAIAAAAAFLVWWRFRYGVGEREIVIEQGVLSRKRRVIPFERVQDIAIEQKLLARLLGVAAVRLETGGSAADEGKLDSIGLADAHRLRDIVRDARVAAPQAGAAAGAEAAEPLLFAMPLGRVLFSGMFQFSLVFMAAIAAILQNLDGWGFALPKQVKPGFEPVLERHWLAFALGFAAIVVLLGFVAGILRTLARDYGFRLTRSAAGLRRRRGLFTLSETVIPMRRMQVALVESGIVARLLGWHGLAFQTLGADRQERGLQVAAPFARMEEIEPIVAEAGFPDPATAPAWHRSPRRSILRRGLAPILAALAAFAVALAWRPEAAIGGGILTLLAAIVAARWTRHVHSEGEAALFVADGLLKRRMKILPYGRLQAVAVVAGPLQRALGLASVAIDTAGARSARSLALIDLERADAEAIAERLLERFKRSRAAERAAR